MVAKSMKIQAIDPRKKDNQPTKRQILVERERSNLLKQEITNPGIIMLVKGSQAHFLNISGVIDGNTITIGLSNRFITQLLQEVYSPQCTIKPTIISITRSGNTNHIAIFNDRILKILMTARIEHTASMSFTNQKPLVIQYTAVIKTPNTKEIISIVLTFQKIFLVKKGHLNRYIVYEKQTITPNVPIPLPTTLSQIETIFGIKYAAIIPITMMVLSAIMTQILISIPSPPYDHALLQRELRIMANVAKQIRINSPHQKGLQNQLGAQLTLYQIGEYSAVIILMRLIWLVLSSAHQLFIVMRQQAGIVQFCTYETYEYAPCIDWRVTFQNKRKQGR